MSQWRKRQGIMLAYPFEEKRLNKWSPPYIVQPKLDGERCRALFTPSGVILLSSEENVIFSVPHINKQLEGQWIEGTELDGELYLHGHAFEQIHSVVSRTVYLHPEHKQMQYHIFDLIDDRPQFKRTVDIKHYHANNKLKNVTYVPSYIAESFDEVICYYNEILSLGYEGIIVRHFDAPYVKKRSTYMMKFKPKKQDEYLIIGWKEEISKDGDPKGTLGALVCVGSDMTEFSVGTGFTHEQRLRLWEEKEQLVNKTCVVSYQHITSGKKVPRFPVFVEII